MNVKNICIDLLEGRLSIDEFMNIAESDNEVFAWLQSVFISNVEKESSTEESAASEEYPMDYIENKLRGYYLLGTIKGKLDFLDEVYRIIYFGFPGESIKRDTPLRNDNRYILTTCPEYIGGEKAQILVEKIYYDLKAQNRLTIPEFRKQILVAFHIALKKPHWLQEPEWPMGEKGIPMEFVSETKIINERREYTFRDVTTGAITVIDQIY